LESRLPFVISIADSGNEARAEGHRADAATNAGTLATGMMIPSKAVTQITASIGATEILPT
jgi:hypothetical protein